MLVYTTGSGVNGFTLNPAIGTFYHSNSSIKIPNDGNIYSINEGNYLQFPEFVKKYINDLQKEDLIDLDKFLNIDDTNLYNFYNGFDTEFEIEKNNISLLFKNFKY